MTVQGNFLSMIGLGVAAATPDVEAGIHLRWTFGPTLGYPAYGFDLYRRNKVDWNSTCVTLSAFRAAFPRSLSSADMKLSSDRDMSYQSAYKPSYPAYPSAQPALVLTKGTTLTITSSKQLRELRIREAHKSGTILFTAYDGATQVAAEQSVSGRANTITLKADRFNRVILNTRDETGIYEICRLSVADGIDVNWGASAGWSPTPINLNLPSDWMAASSRINASVHARYQPHFTKLLEVIKLLPTGSKRYSGTPMTTAPAGSPPPTSFLVNPVRMLLQASLDPNIARMLGLYFLDTTATTTDTYDYKIVGNWKSPTSAEHMWVCFGLARGTPAPVQSPTGIVVRQRAAGGGFSGAATTTKGQMAAALSWDIVRSPGGGLQPGAAILYHVMRQKKSGAILGPQIQLTRNFPIVVSRARATGKLPTDFYIDSPLEKGHYLYQVQGIDIFGRKSALSTSAAININDRVAPPPPINVAGTLTETSSTTANLLISWEWPERRRLQAQNAKEFRVFYQTEDVRPYKGTISSVTDNGDGTSLLETDLDVGNDYSRFASGVLVNRGSVFRVLEINKTTAPLTIKVRNITDGDGHKILPQAARTLTTRAYLSHLKDPGSTSGRFLLQADWSKAANWQASYLTEPVTANRKYRRTHRSVPVNTSSDNPVAYVLVGVCTVDEAGNVGVVSPPVALAVKHSSAPTAPDAATGAEYAARADYYGNSPYTLTIPNTLENLYYEIYRASDAVIQKRAGQDGVDDERLLALADDTEYEGAFVKVGSALAGTGGSLEYTDVLPGTGRNRFLYKIQSLDRAGNRSAMSAARLVLLHDVLPPNAPVTTKITGGDKQVTIQWAKNREDDLALYRLYRTRARDDAADVRRMNLKAAFILDASAASPEDLAADATTSLQEDASGNLIFTDGNLKGSTSYYYRLTAIDKDGNVSAPSAICAARAYDHETPQPPVWTRAGWNTDRSAVALRWTLADATHQPLLQRRQAGHDSAPWLSVSGWLDAGTRTHSDVSADASTSYVYRLKVKNRAGNTSEEFNEKTVEAVE